MTHKYVVPIEVVRKLETLNLGAPALKLVHGMLLHADLAVNGNTGLLWRGMNTAALVRASFLREELGWVSQKGNRPLKEALADPSLRQVLKSAELTSNGRGVSREFQKRFIEVATVKNFDPVKNGSKYALMDTSAIGPCRTCEDILLLTRVAMHRRQDCPKFELTGVGRREQVPSQSTKNLQFKTNLLRSSVTRQNEISASPWAESRERWIHAARKLAATTGDVLLFRVIEGIAEPGVTKVVVLIANSKTIWDPEFFYKCRGGWRLVLVTKDGHKNLSSKEVARRALGDDVPGQ
jgi:hypothetical protein